MFIEAIGARSKNKQEINTVATQIAEIISHELEAAHKLNTAPDYQLIEQQCRTRGLCEPGISYSELTQIAASAVQHSVSVMPCYYLNDPYQA